MFYWFVFCLCNLASYKAALCHIPACTWNETVRYLIKETISAYKSDPEYNFYSDNLKWLTLYMVLLGKEFPHSLDGKSLDSYPVRIS